MHNESDATSRPLHLLSRLSPFQCIFASLVALSLVAIVALSGHHGLILNIPGLLSVESTPDEIDEIMEKAVSDKDKLKQVRFLTNVVNSAFDIAERNSFSYGMMQDLERRLNKYDYYSVINQGDEMINAIVKLKTELKDDFLRQTIVRRLWRDARSGDGIFYVELRNVPIYIDEEIQPREAKICHKIVAREIVHLDDEIDIYRNFKNPVEPIYGGEAPSEAWTATRVTGTWRCRELAEMAWDWSLRISLYDAAVLLGKDVADASVSVDPIINVRIQHAIRDRISPAEDYRHIAEIPAKLRDRLKSTTPPF